MSDRLRLNRTCHCSMCPNVFGDTRNMVRMRLGDEHGPPRVAVCPVHDIAGPVDLLPDSLRPAVTA